MKRWRSPCDISRVSKTNCPVTREAWEDEVMEMKMSEAVVEADPVDLQRALLGWREGTGTSRREAIECNSPAWQISKAQQWKTSHLEQSIGQQPRLNICCLCVKEWRAAKSTGCTSVVIWFQWSLVLRMACIEPKTCAYIDEGTPRRRKQRKNFQSWT